MRYISLRLMCIKCVRVYARRVRLLDCEILIWYLCYILKEDSRTMKVRTAFKVQQQQQATSAEGGGRAESGCTVHSVFPFAKPIADSAREWKREWTTHAVCRLFYQENWKQQQLNVNKRRVQSICLVRTETTRAGLNVLPAKQPIKT